MRPLLLVILFLYCLGSNGQFSQYDYFGMGKNELSDLPWYNLASLNYFSIKEWEFAGAIQARFEKDAAILQDFRVGTRYNFRIKKIPVSAEISYLISLPEKKFLEDNCILLFKIYYRNFEFEVGNNSRRFLSGYNGFSDATVFEPRNLMYRAGYYFPFQDEGWKISVNITNFDHFIVNQETNPMANLIVSKQISPNLKLHSEVWYYSSGLLNIRVNYFSINAKGGLIWSL